ncbi:uncharacterized protein BD780_004005 [Clostridium tetanomorphum]|uniref:ATP-dependent sacrificial sulfur transferase LarE n=1 Tax=Clostridium tetanomorphum TaxID=1553 RepID=A0A923EEN7_CLOTT|nr:ATP-dependent sacrificial sulfur transferase LarE [Clostridium tetanomorphum]KAJ53308.1 hypothetical protein CTM_03419 [Clostridium tetanomorphum DSM 665]MBC2400169.1 ATP-dependent sacrificial sulfur transferase LarE [Clostridium tetanomorphum]MBP1865660.1 uncharacterized protein [Clostridium tetanomorphum]NRS86780.1 uncharacterized protein [Clostridium tetanomorphum]NRZ99465.1 uncharacterized protein [Clostridium tetanomorphum]
MIDSYKYKSLVQYIKKLGKVCIAFSGGVDSTFLLKVAKETLNDCTIAVTIKSPYIPAAEVEEAKMIARNLGIKHYILESEIIEDIKLNPKNRCYICKKNIFQKIIDLAKEKGIENILDGSNLDDTKDYRPGIRALEELNIRSPLKELSITKEEIRYFSKKLQLNTWDKPSYACLLSRLPYDINIDIDELKKIEKGENYLHNIGFKGARIRSYKDMARIEVDKKDIRRFLSEELTEDIVSKLKTIGYKYITLDLEGYRMGSMNEGIEEGIRNE